MKRIIICCDGTGQQFQENKSNPLRLHYCLRNSESQVSFYDPGVGTFDPGDGVGEENGFLGDLWSSATQFLGGKAFGYGVERNIADAYRYLMNMYEPGDQIFLFGFSRGAFTAHAVAGLLKKCGLLARHNDNLIPYAMDIYLQKGNTAVAKDFKETMAIDCPVRMLGLWDTVKSLGRKHRDDYFLGNDVTALCEAGLHLVALDEKRTDFTPELWGNLKKANFYEIWFPGVHGDVGGGYDDNPLANEALQWMIEAAAALKVEFREERVNEFQPDILAAPHDSYTGGWMARGASPRAIDKTSLIHPKLRVHRKKYGQSKQTPTIPTGCRRANPSFRLPTEEPPLA